MYFFHKFIDSLVPKLPPTVSGMIQLPVAALAAMAQFLPKVS